MYMYTHIHTLVCKGKGEEFGWGKQNLEGPSDRTEPDQAKHSTQDSFQGGKERGKK